MAHVHLGLLKAFNGGTNSRNLDKVLGPKRKPFSPEEWGGVQPLRKDAGEERGAVCPHLPHTCCWDSHRPKPRSVCPQALGEQTHQWSTSPSTTPAQPWYQDG